jgi:hypothetical protein
VGELVGGDHLEFWNGVADHAQGMHETEPIGVQIGLERCFMKLEIIEIDETPPPLDLTPEEIEALADELIDYHAEFADLYYRIEQAVSSKAYFGTLRWLVTKVTL